MAASEAVREITDANFDATIGSGKPVLLDFWATWCSPCRAIGVMIEELAPSYDGKAIIGKVNLDENQQVASRLGVMSAPTLVMFKAGQVVDRVVGALPKTKLQAFIDRNL
jgi:thioredoxin 1